MKSNSKVFPSVTWLYLMMSSFVMAFLCPESLVAIVKLIGRDGYLYNAVSDRMSQTMMLLSAPPETRVESLKKGQTVCLINFRTR